MGQKIDWVDNLRGIACIMVVTIHATSFQVVNFSAIDTASWGIANLLNSASRVSVPLFFMISGFLFFGEKRAQARHFLRIGICLLFYSAVSLLYILLLTKIGFWPSLRHILQKPVFYHLWFFYAIGLIYLLSPFIRVREVAQRTVLAVGLVLGVLANPYLPALEWQGFHLLPLNLSISGDAFYYLLYALMGRALGVSTFSKRWVGWVAGSGFIISSLLIAAATRMQSHINQNFADTFYVYCGPLVFIAAISLFICVKQTLAARPLPGLALISRHSLAIYGFHALIIIALRSRHLDFPQHPLLNIIFLFASGLGGGLLLALLLRRIDGKRWVS